MKILLLADFGGLFPEKLRKRLEKADWDIGLVAGDFADIKAIRDIFLKYGNKEREYYNKLSKARKQEIKKKKFRTGMDVLKKLNSLGRPVYLVSGNNEIADYRWFSKTVSRYGNLKLIDDKLSKFSRLALVGIRNEHRVYGERGRLTREDFYDYQENMLKGNFRGAKTKNIILLSHYPPYGCRLDKLPKNAKLNPGSHVGSYLIREIIERLYPPFVICGHLEELGGVCKIGKTVVINPGGADVGKYAILEVNNKNFRKSKIRFYKV